MSDDYIPKPGSLPAQVCTHFQLHPDDALTADSIAEKFQASRNSVHTNLAKCIEAGLLRRFNGDEGMTYKRGSQLKAVSAFDLVAPPPKAPAAPKTTRVRPPAPPIDLAALPIQTDVPIPELKRKLNWAQLFDRLPVNGSAPVPTRYLSALKTAINDRHKAPGSGRFTTRQINDEEVRVWRTE